jgi:hypothetical protein
MNVKSLWSYFLKTKDEQVQLTTRQMIYINNEKKVQVNYIRCDNSGENHDLQNQINDNHLKLVCRFDSTAPDSPQQNGKVEIELTTLYDREWAKLNKAKCNWLLRHAKWAYSSLHATKLDSLLIRPITQLRLYDMYHGKTPARAVHLHSLVEIAVVISTAKIHSKLDNKCFPAIYLVPSEDHRGYTYLLDPKTKHRIESRSAVFLRKTYGEIHKLDKSEIAIQIAAITDELKQMFDIDDDITPVAEDGKKSPNKTFLDDDEASYVSVDQRTMLEEAF